MSILVLSHRPHLLMACEGSNKGSTENKCSLSSCQGMVFHAATAAVKTRASLVLIWVVETHLSRNSKHSQLHRRRWSASLSMFISQNTDAFISTTPPSTPPTDAQIQAYPTLYSVFDRLTALLRRSERRNTENVMFVVEVSRDVHSKQRFAN